jgi:hypothetical protein
MTLCPVGPCKQEGCPLLPANLSTPIPTDIYQTPQHEAASDAYFARLGLGRQSAGYDPVRPVPEGFGGCAQGEWDGNTQ